MGAERASDLLLRSIDSDRVDMLCSMLGELKNTPDYHEHVDGVCSEHGTLLHHAVCVDKEFMVVMLLEKGANPCVQDDDGRTPYQLCQSDNVKSAFVREALRCISLSNTERVCQLISSGLPVDSVDSKETKNSLLNWAADFGSVDVVRALLNLGASVDYANSKGETPLLVAVRKGRIDVVTELLSAGADQNYKSGKGDSPITLATAKGGPILDVLNADKLNRGMVRAHSIESLDAVSVISTDTLNHSTFERPDQKVEAHMSSWTDLLWPQPSLIKIFDYAAAFQFPSDHRFKIYFDDASDGCPRRMMQAIQSSVPLLVSFGLDLEYRGHKTADHDASPLTGKITCGLFHDGRPSGSYTLSIDHRGVEIVAPDYSGIRYAFATFVQIIRVHRFVFNQEKTKNNSISSYISPNSSISYNSSNENSFTSSPAPAILTASLTNGTVENELPALTVSDIPDRAFRAVYEDFSGCRILNTETVLHLATKLSHCKANYLFLNFEVRTTDRYQLPYTNRDLFNMMQVCDEMFVTLVPSLDTQSNYIDAGAAKSIIELFLDDFPLSKTAHFGPNLSSILVGNKAVLSSVQRRVPRIFLSVDVNEKNAATLSAVPPYVTLCVEGHYPFEAEQLLSPRVSLVLKFSTGDDGYLCAAPHSTAQKALLAAKLSEKANVLGSMICDLSTGCETMPLSLSYVSLLASVGVGWNSSTDMKKFGVLLPLIAANHVLFDGAMVALFEQAITIGNVEHQLTKFAYGIKTSPNPQKQESISGFGLNKKQPISVFVEMILNPENLALERLTPVAFKKARIELKRTLQALIDARRQLPYNFELALVVAEIELVTELMVLITKLGQALCRYTGTDISRKASLEGLKYLPGRVGVAHLPLATRTDLANNLLEIRSQFQHVWLSRSIPSTLPNALKMFDNLFKVLLPPEMQDIGKQLL